MTTNELFDKWKTAYDRLTAEEDEGINDLDFFSIAVGFCMSQGLSYNDACKFYHKTCIPSGKF